ncbi:MAG: phosphate ABC transporter ATP-binding protein [Firmicutes bacterium]|nr:phosphate ABC transporter ATP-binding protein [Bacillota bacterium]
MNIYKRKLIAISGRLNEVEVLRDVSFGVRGGEVTALLGPSGSGKSTVLRILNRLEDPSSGQVLLDGVDTCSLDVRALRQRVGMVFQVPALLGGTVRDNILYGPRMRQRRCDVAMYLDMVGLERELQDRPATALSVGQQQRVAIARALANEPEVLLLDEPTSALDGKAAHNILDLILRFNSSLGLTVVIVTHILEHARAVADHVVLLVAGRKIEDGPAAKFFQPPSIEIGRGYLEGNLEVNETGSEKSSEKNSGENHEAQPEGGFRGNSKGTRI